MVQERRRAEELEYPDPICGDMESTHASYDRCVATALPAVASGRAEFMVASHNQQSVEHTIQGMARHGIGPDGPVYFGQLLGMCDHVSYTLGTDGYRVYKYVPYGPVHECVAYLVRRVEENSTLLGSPAIAHERQLIADVLRGRLVPSFDPFAWAKSPPAAL